MDVRRVAVPQVGADNQVRAAGWCEKPVCGRVRFQDVRV